MGRLGPGIPSLALTKATLKVMVGNGVPMELSFQYNPEELTVSRSSDWSHPTVIGAEDGSSPTFVSTGPRTVSMKVFFDAYSTLGSDISKDVNTLFAWTRPCPQLIDGRLQPPQLGFGWGMTGVLTDFEGYLESVTANYTLFRMDGSPIRATCDISLTEIPNPVEAQNPTSGSKRGLQSHVVLDGESLHSIAWAYYRNPAYWRALAEFNGIDDPMRVATGTQILLPSTRVAAGMV